MTGAALIALASAACTEQLPTFGFDRDVPVDAVSFEVRVPFDEFAEEAFTLGGFGFPAELVSQIAANSFGDSLDAHVLARADTFPSSIVTPDSLGESRVDTLFTVPQGRLIVGIDTANANPGGELTLVAEALSRDWDRRTTTWTMAVDSIDRQEAWEEPGGGPVTFLGSGTWDRADAGADSVVIQLDSAAIEVLRNDTLPSPWGFRIRVEQEGRRARIRSMRIEGDARPSVKPDTLVGLNAAVLNRTFIYSPYVEPEAGDLYVGGAPSFRSILTFSLPDSIYPDAEVCAQIDCPVALDEDIVLFASVVLTGKIQEEAYRPVNDILMDIRGVTEPEKLPRSPLSPPVIFANTGAVPEIFAPGEGGVVEIPVTTYLRDLLRGETPGGNPVFPTAAVITPVEPFTFEVMRFHGPESENAPYLRILFTVADQVGLN